MNLRQLRYFLAVAETLNFTQAAKRLCIAQPPLSRQIRDLEADIGAPLFERDGHRIRLTPTGRALREEAYDILERCQQALANTRAVAQGASGQLVIGYMPVAFCYQPFVQTLRRFQADYPGVRLSLLQMAPAAQREALLQRRIDFGVMHLDTANPELHATRCIFDEPGEMAFAADHPLADAGDLRLADIANEPLIMMPRRWCPIFYDRCLWPWRERGLQPHIVQDTESYAVSLSLVASGMGITLGSPALRGHFTIPVKAVIVQDVNVRLGAELVWNAAGATPVMLRFIETLERHTAPPAGRKTPAAARGTARRGAGDGAGR